jgi:hypothetical protein
MQREDKLSWVENCSFLMGIGDCCGQYTRLSKVVKNMGCGRLQYEYVISLAYHWNL